MQWSIEQSEKVYHISKWGQDHFFIGDNGHLHVSHIAEKQKEHAIDLMDIVDEIQKVMTLNKTFNQVIEEANYQGKYMGVYPIKVNQMREVVEEITDAGEPYNIGLEAGSKAELMVVLAYNSNLQALTILNGYKDDDYLRLALLGRKLGRKLIIVVEKFSEVNRIIQLSRQMDVVPLIGIRAKLAAKSLGRWSGSSGELAKFGLTIPEILQVIKILKKEEMIDSLKLLHFHMGSQIPDIKSIKGALTEAARIYTKLNKLGARLEYFDVGGGLGVDYNGSRSVMDSSTNYGMQDYAEDIIYIVKQICDLEEVEHPHIVTETGRALVAHHSCVVTNVFGQVGPDLIQHPTAPTAGEHILVKNMRELESELGEENYLEIYNDALQFKEEAYNAFKLGVLNLEERGKIETIFWRLNRRLQSILESFDDVPEQLEDINYNLSMQYLCNFSVFQSMADSWAIGQLLPIVPLNRLDEKPTVQTTLVDITCDSDGKIKQYIGEDHGVIRPTIPLHHLKSGEDYFVGIFLTGAYQDIMGDMHNLFGRVNEVHVFFDAEDPENFYIEEYIPGNSSQQILKTMQYNPDFMALTLKKAIDRQVKRGKIRPREGVNLIDFYEYCLNSYTYMR
jgi:arginine decarboxylase